MSASEQATAGRRRKASTGRKTLWWCVCLAPMLAAFVLQWLPILNGPHLFLGLPTIMWWTCIPGSLMISLVLAIVEFTRTDSSYEELLDHQAVRRAEAQENRGEQS